MRVDPNYVTNLASSISQSTSTLANLSNELSSGLRVNNVGDDPVAAEQALQLASSIAQSDTFVQTASQETGHLQVTGSALGEVVTQLTSAISLATQGSNATLNASDRAALVTQLRGIQSQVLALANTSYQGQYIFAGSQGSTKPYTLDVNGNATYAGDAVQQSIQTPGGGSIVTNLAGSSVFQGSTGDAFAALSKVISDLSTDPIASTTAADSTLLTSALSNVSEQRSVLDSSLSRLQASSTYAQTQEANVKVQQSSLVSADPATVATDLQSAETQHEALLNLVATLNKGSLFDYLQ